MARILVIDDEPRVLSVIQEVLRLAGHDVTGATDGRVGLRSFHEAPADLVITDIVMPDKEGIETIRELRYEFPNVKIIAISGGGICKAEGYLSLAQTLGADGTLSKPIARIELLAMVSQLLNGRSKGYAAKAVDQRGETAVGAIGPKEIEPGLASDKTTRS